MQCYHMAGIFRGALSIFYLFDKLFRTGYREFIFALLFDYKTTYNYRFF